jgi:hypothetical protein
MEPNMHYMKKGEIHAVGLSFLRVGEFHWELTMWPVEFSFSLPIFSLTEKNDTVTITNREEFISSPLLRKIESRECAAAAPFPEGTLLILCPVAAKIIL